MSPRTHLGEALHVQAQAPGEPRYAHAAAAETDVVGDRHTVKLAHDVEDGDLSVGIMTSWGTAEDGIQGINPDRTDILAYPH